MIVNIFFINGFRQFKRDIFDGFIGDAKIRQNTGYGIAAPPREGNSMLLALLVHIGKVHGVLQHEGAEITGDEGKAGQEVILADNVIVRQGDGLHPGFPILAGMEMIQGVADRVDGIIAVLLQIRTRQQVHRGSVQIDGHGVLLGLGLPLRRGDIKGGVARVRGRIIAGSLLNRRGGQPHGAGCSLLFDAFRLHAQQGRSRLAFDLRNQLLQRFRFNRPHHQLLLLQFSRKQDFRFLGGLGLLRGLGELLVKQLLRIGIVHSQGLFRQFSRNLPLGLLLSGRGRGERLGQHSDGRHFKRHQQRHQEGNKFLGMILHCDRPLYKSDRSFASRAKN